ncbi:MAG: Gfo/Idh/MocA family oxidoreductase [Bacteroidia bacterium]|nr:Gfo/Idh/MocA family oxidoreductase [Bacteroidia bacterium]
MYKALVIGCGNIGAMYDFENNEIQTHTKALVLNGNFEVSVFDANTTLAQKVAQKYQIQAIEEIENLKDYDLVSICSPTETHIHYLEECLEAKVKLIICEKPICYNKLILQSTHNKFANYYSGDVKILVNYPRPFLPAYQSLKKDIQNILQADSLISIIIKYYKGLLNYASHAFNLLEFLLDKRLRFTQTNIFSKAYDFFKEDPTISAFAWWDSVPVHIIGLTKTNFSIFELELYFQNHKILIHSQGNIIDIYQKNEQSYGVFPTQPTKTYQNCLKDYMKYVISHAENMLKDKTIQDNFDGAANINQFLLQIIENK